VIYRNRRRAPRWRDRIWRAVCDFGILRARAERDGASDAWREGAQGRARKIKKMGAATRMERPPVSSARPQMGTGEAARLRSGQIILAKNWPIGACAKVAPAERREKSPQGRAPPSCWLRAPGDLS